MRWNWTPQCSSKVSFSACKRSAREPCGAQRNLTLCNSILPTLRSGVYVLAKERFFFWVWPDKWESNSKMLIPEEKKNLKQINLRICFLSACLLLGWFVLSIDTAEVAVQHRGARIVHFWKLHCSTVLHPGRQSHNRSMGKPGALPSLGTVDREEMEQLSVFPVLETMTAQKKLMLRFYFCSLTIIKNG